MPTVPPAQLTDADLRAAWDAHCKGRPTWPDTFEEAMADPTYSRLLQLAAKHPPSGRWPLPTRVDRIQPSSPQRAKPLPGMRPLPMFDRKRAAAGDHDD